MAASLRGFRYGRREPETDPGGADAGRLYVKNAGSKVNVP